MAGDDKITDTIPPWAKGLGKYVIPWLAALLAAYIQFHDMAQDIEALQQEADEHVVRLVKLEEQRAAAALAQSIVNTRVSGELEHTESAVDKLNATLERFLLR